MKKSILLTLFVGLFLIGSLGARHYRQSLSSCKTKQSCKDLHGNCKCFCAWHGKEGGYRDKMPKQDHPIFFADSKKDKFGKGCYCAARDIKVLQAVAKGMPIYEARQKYQNYNSPSEKIRIRLNRLRANS